MIPKIHDTEISAVTDCLMSVPTGGLVTFEAMSAAIGRDILQHRYLFNQARKKALDEHGAVFESARGQGYQRLAPADALRVGPTSRRRIRRIAARGSNALAAVQRTTNDMSDDIRRKFIAEQTSLNLVRHLSRDKSLPVIQEKVKRPLPYAVAAKEFLRTIGAAVPAED